MRSRSKPQATHRSATAGISRNQEQERPGELSPRLRWAVLIGEAVLLIAVALAVLWPAPIHPNQLPAADSETDLMISHWPSALLVKRTISLEHRLPLWNPFFAGGRPLAADPLAAIFYPPTQLVNLFPIRDYYLILLVGHLVFAGAGTLLLARRTFRLSHWSALVAAVSFMATPRLIGHLGAGHVTLVQTATWFPWLALGSWATVNHPRRWAAPFGVVLALTLLAGHPQMAYYGLMMTAAITLWLLYSRGLLRNPRRLVAPLVGLAVAGIGGLLLAAIHLLPLAEFTARSTRQDAIPVTDAYPLLVFLRGLIGRTPGSATPWEDTLQPGNLVLLLAIIGVIAAGRRALPLLGGIVLVATLAMGYASPIFRLAAHLLPSFDRFHGLSRIWLVALLGIALLAGFGAEALLGLIRGAAPRRVRQVQLLVGLILLLLVAVPLVRIDHDRARVGSITPATVPGPLIQRAAELAGSSRVYGVQRNLGQLKATELNLRLADGWDPLMIESYVRFMQPAGGYEFDGYQLTIPARDGQPNARLLGLMHVGVVVSRTPLTDPALTEVETIDDTHIYRNTEDAGPAYLVQPGPDGAPPDATQLQRIPSEVTADYLSREEDRFSVTTTAPAYLVVADPAYPGWKATLDGEPAPIELIGGVLPAIRVEAGTHEVVYHYQPTSVRVGAGLSLIGLLLTLAGLIFGRSDWADRRFGASRITDEPAPASIDASLTR